MQNDIIIIGIAIILVLIIAIIYYLIKQTDEDGVVETYYTLGEYVSRTRTLLFDTVEFREPPRHFCPSQLDYWRLESVFNNTLDTVYEVKVVGTRIVNIDKLSISDVEMLKLF